jgi:hypothetical protein
MPDTEDTHSLALAERVRSLSPTPWVGRVLAGGAVILALRLWWPASALGLRLARDLTVFVALPVLLAVRYGGDIGWRVDRTAVRDAALLAAFVAPFYVVGSTLPTVRAYYPAWRTTLALGEFLPHAVGLVLVAFAAETYYRGLLCVGLRELGPRCVLVSPVVYALMHTGKPPVELLLSGPTDVLFGAVDYNSGSVLPSTVAHGGGFVLLDYLVLRDPVIPPDRVLASLRWLPVPL